MRRWTALGVVAIACACTPSRSESTSTSTGTSTSTRLAAVSIDGTYFVREGKRFLPIGAHWVPAKGGMRWPLEWDPKAVEADFAKMKELGLTLVRVDFLWAWIEPQPGHFDASAFEKIDFLVSLAHEYGVYLHPSLFIGGEVGEAYWDVPWRNGKNPHTDPEMLAGAARHAAELGRRYKNETAIIAWDLTDEPPFWITTGVTDAQAITWTKTIAAAIRERDHMHPIVVGTSGQETSHGPFRADVLSTVRELDFSSVHPFTIYRPELFPDAMLSQRSTYGAAFDIALARGAGRPAMVQEIGASTAQYSPERVASYERANLYSALGAGSIGVDVWCFTDAAPGERSRLPYLRTPQETEWGIVTWDRAVKPRGRELQAFANVVRQLDLAGVSPVRGDVAFPIPHEWAKVQGELASLGITGKEKIPYVSTEDTVSSQAKLDSGNAWLMGSALSTFVLGRRAGLTVDFPRERGEWAARKIVALPSPLTSTSTPFLTHVHTDFYARAKKFVEDGGVLYASVAADAAVPDMDALFGARLADTNTAKEITITLVERFGGLEPGTKIQFTVPFATTRYWGSLLEVSRGKTLAVDQDGHPAVVLNALGRGKTLLVAYPLEAWLAVTPSAFDQYAHVLTDALYRGLGELAASPAPFRTDDPAIEATTLAAADHRYVVLVNHGPKDAHVTVTSAAAMRHAERITPDGVVALAADVEKQRFVVDLRAWEGTVVAIR
jgi:endo-1,4-beta-mannosidase